MPKFQYHAFPLANEEVFEDFIRDLFNEIDPGYNYDLFGRRGQNQHGIDIISFERRIAIQCKKKDTSYSASSKEDIKSQLLTDFTNDVEKVSKSSLSIEKFIFITTFPNDKDLQNLANELAKKETFKIEYWGWGKTADKLEKAKQTFEEYYQELILENDIITDDHFKKSVKGKHIIDQIYLSLSRFDGFNYIDPRVISKIFPFRSGPRGYITRFHFKCVLTDNPELSIFYNLLNSRDDYLSIKKKDLKKVLKTCEDANEKVNKIINILRSSHINCLETPDRKHNNFKTKTSTESCDCECCNYERLEMNLLTNKGLIDTVKPKIPSMKKVYANYKLHQYSRAFNLITDIEQSALNQVEEFLCAYNKFWLNHLLNSSKEGDKIDLERLINKLNIEDEPLKEVIIDLKENRILSRAHIKFDKYLEEIERIQVGYANQTLTTNSGPQYVHMLSEDLEIVYNYYRKNCIIHDVYEEFVLLCRKSIHGWLTSLNTNERYPNRLDQFYVFQVAICVMYSSGDDLIKMMSKTGVKHIILDKQAQDYLSKIVLNYFNSFNDSKSNYNQSTGISFKSLLTDNFGLISRQRQLVQAILIMLAYSNIECPTSLFKKLKKFLIVNDFLYSFDLKFVGVLFSKKGKWFTYEEHLELIELSLINSNLDSTELIEQIVFSMEENFPSVFFKSKQISSKLIEKLGIDVGYIYVIISILSQSKKDDKLYILSELKKKLDDKFNETIYRQLFIANFININEGDYFKLYIDIINQQKGRSIVEDQSGFEKVSNYTFLNFISGILLAEQIDLSDNRIISNLTELSLYQKWLLDPINFEYSHFSINWIRFSDVKIILQYLGKSEILIDIVKKSLNNKFNERLAKSYLIMIS